YDPKLGRFLTPDPTVPAPHFSQSWNPYSYVYNNPLAYVDPSGFDPDEPDQEPKLAPGTYVTYGKDGNPTEVVVVGDPRQGEKTQEAADPGESASTPGEPVARVDVSIIGTLSGFIPQPTLSDHQQHSLYIITEVGFGAVDAFAEIGLGMAKAAVLNSLTAGGYGVY